MQLVRILTQERQIGDVFKKWEEQKPNKMLLGHQDWLGKFSSHEMDMDGDVG